MILNASNGYKNLSETTPLFFRPFFVLFVVVLVLTSAWFLFLFTFVCHAAGADIGALSSSAYSKALERKLSQLRDQAGGEEKIKLNSKDGRNEIQGPESHTTDRTTPASSIKLTAYINSLSNSDLMVSVSMSDFLFAVTNIKPSVTRSELDHYEALGEEFNDLVPWH